MIMIYSDLKNQNLNQDISENDIQDDHDFEYQRQLGSIQILKVRIWTNIILKTIGIYPDLKGQYMSEYDIKDNWDLPRS